MIQSPTSHSAPSLERSLLGLELARFVCALAVVFWHYQHFFYVDGKYPLGFQRSVQPAYAWLWPFYEFGFLGVAAFWCISGFIFFYKYKRPLTAGAVSARRFAQLRFSRLYPLHLATLLLVAPLAWWYEGLTRTSFVYEHNDLRHFILQLCMASDWGVFERSSSFNGPIWSISVEVVVYAVFFLLTRRVGTPLALVLGVIGLTSAVVAAHLSDNYIYRCLMFFYLGGLTQVVHERSLALPLWQRLALPLSSAVLVAAAMFYVTPLRNLPPIVKAIPLTPLALLFLLSAVRPRTQRVARVLAALGNTTYASYLLHFPLQLASALLFVYLGRAMPAAEPWWLALFMLATFGLAFPVYRYFEQPMQTWLRGRFAQPPPSTQGDGALQARSDYVSPRLS